MIRLPRVLRLDASDTLVFARAAVPDEVAVAGGFLFWDTDPATLDGKGRAAFRSGFLGVTSFGFSTLVAVGEATAEQRDAAIAALAENLVRHLGAPDLAAARPAAAEEIAHAERLCEGHPPNTVLALARSLEDGALRERFRSLTPRQAAPAPHSGLRPVFSVVAEEADAEPMDLTRLPLGR